MNTMIIYTDGSFRPNCEGTYVGFWGSGVHGYIFTTDESIKTITDKPTKYVITDIGYIRNEEMAKYKDKVKEVKPLYYLDACYSFLNKGTVNTGELSAVIEVLKDIIAEHEKLNIDKITIHTDSMYVVFECNKILNNTKTIEEKDKPNKEYLEEVRTLFQKLLELGITIDIQKVAGHSNNLGNDLADMLAFHARLQSSNRNIFRMFNIFEVTSKSKYWGFNLDRHPLLEYKQLFFTNSLRGTNDDIFYSILDYKTDKDPGSKTHDACFGLVRLNHTQDVIESAISAYHKACNHMSIISTLDLNTLYSRLNSFYYHILGPSIYHFIYGKYTLNNLNKEPIVYTIHPPGLATQALERTQYLHYLMSEFKTREIKPTVLRKFIDITEYVYDVKEDKKGNKKYTTIIPQSAEYIEVNVDAMNNETVPVFIILGKDTLSRNQFKHLEKDNPRVYLITETKSPDMMTYYTLVETETGDLGVFCNFYSGRVLLQKKNKK